MSLLRALSRLRRCPGIGGQCFYRLGHEGPCFNGRCAVWPGPPAPVVPLGVLMHEPGPLFTEGTPLAPGVCPCERCTPADFEPADE